MEKDELKSEVTSSRPRDEKGHFISPPKYSTAKNPLEKFLISHTGNYKDEDDLLDIHIGNPLRRVIEVLEEIKKQKAFSFTIKGSLGIAGVVLAFSFFGLVGGSKIICNKGNQSHIGLVKSLAYREIYSESLPLLGYVLDIVTPPKKFIKNSTILITQEGQTINLPYSKHLEIGLFSNKTVIATGEYDSCSRSLVIDQSSGVEEFSY